MLCNAYRNGQDRRRRHPEDLVEDRGTSGRLLGAAALLKPSAHVVVRVVIRGHETAPNRSNRMPDALELISKPSKSVSVDETA